MGVSFKLVCVYMYCISNKNIGNKNIFLVTFMCYYPLNQPIYHRTYFLIDVTREPITLLREWFLSWTTLSGFNLRLAYLPCFLLLSMSTSLACSCLHGESRRRVASRLNKPCVKPPLLSQSYNEVIFYCQMMVNPEFWF